jgi:hypothetical protein
MITATSGAAALASGPVTAEERAARWGHRGGVLHLTGPVELIDQIERSLFVRGAITARIEADDEAFHAHYGLVELLIRSKALTGMIALVVHLTGGEMLTARAVGEQITVDAKNAQEAVAAVNSLLLRSEILLSAANTDWVI